MSHDRRECFAPAGRGSDVTVIIPTRNRRNLLLRTLRSVLAQDDVRLSVVIVDDAGDDHTGLAAAATGDQRVRIVRHEARRGVSAARNSGLAVATTPWVAFVDDDDVWAPDKLRQQLDAVSTTEAARWSCVGSVNIDAQGRVLWWADAPYEVDLSAELLARNCIPGGGSGVLADTDLAREIGGFDENMSNLADWDFYVRLAQRSPIAPVHAPLLGYLVHADSMAHNINRSDAEYRYMGRKYAELRRARGVVPDQVQWLRYLAGMAYNGGHRVAGARMCLRLGLRHGQLRSLRSVGMAVVPTSVYRSRARRGSTKIPQAWKQGVEEWLRPYAPTSDMEHPRQLGADGTLQGVAYRWPSRAAGSHATRGSGPRAGATSEGTLTSS